MGFAAPTAWRRQEIDEILIEKVGCKISLYWWWWEWFNDPKRGCKVGTKLFSVWVARVVSRPHCRLISSTHHWVYSWGAMLGKYSRLVTGSWVGGGDTGALWTKWNLYAGRCTTVLLAGLFDISGETVNPRGGRWTNIWLTIHGWLRESVSCFREKMYEALLSITYDYFSFCCIYYKY